MTTLLGTTGLGADSANSNNSGIFFAIRLQALATGTITSVGLKVGATNPTTAHSAIYADNGGGLSAATRLSADVTKATTTANAVNVWDHSANPVAVVAGQFYWLEFGASSGAFSYTDNVVNPDGGTTRDTSAQTTCPATHAATTGSFTNVINAYADGTLTTTTTAASPLLNMLQRGGVDKARALAIIHPWGAAPAAVVAADQTLIPTAIDTAEAFGTPVVAPGSVSVSPTAIDTAEAFGTPVVTSSATITPTGIASTEAFGTPVVSATADVVPTGIASGEAFGTPVVGTTYSLVPTGIASGEAFGTPVVTAGDVTVSPTGIASGETFGTPVVSDGSTGATVPLRPLTGVGL